MTTTQNENTRGPRLDVLVVDDDDLLRRILIGTLGEKFPTFEFRESNNGSLAMGMIAQRVPDIIILDLRMPGLNGFAMLRLLRSRDMTQQVPIVIISALSDSDNVRKALELGANDYCVKPLDYERLSDKLEQICLKQLGLENLPKNQRTTPRQRVRLLAPALLPLFFPEEDGFWIESPRPVEPGTPILVDFTELLTLFKIATAENRHWTRVIKNCRDNQRLLTKLVFDPIPPVYLHLRNKMAPSKRRWEQIKTTASNRIVVTCPIVVNDISGTGIGLSGTLPWSEDDEITLDLARLEHLLGTEVPRALAKIKIRWKRSESGLFTAGAHFTQLPDDLRNQIMNLCLKQE